MSCLELQVTPSHTPSFPPLSLFISVLSPPSSSTLYRSSPWFYPCNIYLTSTNAFPAHHFPPVHSFIIHGTLLPLLLLSLLLLLLLLLPLLLLVLLLLLLLLLQSSIGSVHKKAYYASQKSPPSAQSSPIHPKKANRCSTM